MVRRNDVKKGVLFRLPPERYKKLRAVAVENDTTVQALMETACGFLIDAEKPNVSEAILSQVRREAAQ